MIYSMNWKQNQKQFLNKLNGGIGLFITGLDLVVSGDLNQNLSGNILQEGFQNIIYGV